VNDNERLLKWEIMNIELQNDCNGDFGKERKYAKEKYVTRDNMRIEDREYDTFSSSLENVINL
jgi:hypothetical protein